MDEPTFAEFIDLVYGAAVDANLWPDVLRRFADLVGASGALLLQQDVNNGRGSQILVNVDPEATPLYFDHWAPRRPLNLPPQMPAEQWSRMVVTDEYVMPKSEFTRTAYYADYLRRFDVHSLLSVKLARTVSDTFQINLLRPARRDLFDEPELKLARQARSHLARAFSVGQKLAEVRAQNDALGAWAEEYPNVLFLLDESGTVLKLNAAARKLLDQSGGLRLSHGRLTAQSPHTARELEGLIAKVGAVGGGGSVRLVHPGSRRPLLLAVSTGPRRDPSPFYPRNSIIVCAGDPDAGGAPAETALRDQFGLTPAEARLTLALAEGLTLREISEAFQLSPHTLHRQLAHVFDKTETHRQSELIALVLRTAGPRSN